MPDMLSCRTPPASRIVVDYHLRRQVPSPDQFTNFLSDKSHQPTHNPEVQASPQRRLGVDGIKASYSTMTVNLRFPQRGYGNGTLAAYLPTYLPTYLSIYTSQGVGV